MQLKQLWIFNGYITKLNISFPEKTAEIYLTSEISKIT